MKAIILAGLVAAFSPVAVAQPRHIYRDGQYFFCPHPYFDPYCQLPNDYSAALHRRPDLVVPPEYGPGPPVVVMPGLPPALATEADRAIRNALRPRYRPPQLPQPAPNIAPAAPPPRMSMEEEREYIIRQGEAHCRKYPQDTQVCHPPKQ